MIYIHKPEPAASQKTDFLKAKRPISERKLRANRANAKRSTGPRTQAGRAISRRNALKHGILSQAIDLPPMITRADQRLLKAAGLFTSGSLPIDSRASDVARILEKMMRVLALEKDCMQCPDGLKQKGKLLHRYERMLSAQLHKQICSLSGLEVKARKNKGRNS